MMIVQQRSTFQTETDARAHLESLLSGYYRLVPEVRLTHDCGDRLRIDYVGIPRHNCPIELRTEIIGFEIKRGYSSARSFIRVLQQAIDYRHCRITDQRATVYQNHRIPFVMVFPDYGELRQQPEPRPNFDWIYGCIRLAGRYNVGVVRQQRTWGGQRFVEFEVAGSSIWQSHRGIVNGQAFGTARKRGSQ